MYVLFTSSFMLKNGWTASHSGTLCKYVLSYLLDVSEELPPVRLMELVDLHVQQDLGEVELRRVPAADAVVRAEVALDLEAVRRTGIPLQKK